MSEEALDDEGFDEVDDGEVPSEIRERLALALDVDDVVAARRLAADLDEFFGTIKVGLELYTAAGPDVIAGLVANEWDVFADLKLHDIPTTVNKAARVVGSLGVRWLTVHTSGGEAMLRAAVEGLAEGAEGLGGPQPGVLGVTVLTSDAEASSDVLEQRTSLAAETGCAGIICAGPDLPITEPWADQLVRVVPGTRMPGSETHDQARTLTPQQAIYDGADLLVIGRAVTAAEEPILAAAELVSYLLG
jgi:orotidine-5'-phosphate decarboxylase